MFKDARDLRHGAAGFPHVHREGGCVPRARSSSSGRRVEPVSELAYRDLGGGVHERANTGGSVGLGHVGAQPAHPLVLARLDASVQVVRMQLVNPVHGK